jgi:uncharacterized protein (TIGR00299 family) protein
MIGYLDVPSGISGDIFLGCLVDAGWPVEELRSVVRRLALPTSEWSIEARPVMKGPMRATLVDVQAPEGHHHRHLGDIRRMIDAADLAQAVKDRAIAVFGRLAAAEAKVHGTTADQIHFHEVGAVDALIDIVGSVAGLNALGIEQLYCGPLPLGEGWAKSAHGQIPLPAPATLELLAAAGAPSRPAPGPGELVTPTGAALVAELARFEQPVMELTRIGTGAGQRECAWPNIARLWLGQLQSQSAMVELQTNIDDMNPQLFAAVSDRLFAAGARDVWLTPIQMKKNRPAILISVLTPAGLEPVLTDILLRETTTLGVRARHFTHRAQARREMRQVETRFGPIDVKLKWVGPELVGAAPEFDHCRAAAEKAGAPVKEVYDVAVAAAEELLGRLRAQQPAASAIVAPAPTQKPAHEHGHDHPHTHEHPHGHSHDGAHAHDHPHEHS